MNKTERLKNSTLNVSSNTIIYFLQTILSFLVRTFFIRNLGAELLGLDSLLINVLSALSLVELGFSSAISYGLYKPLADKNIKKINAYMSFYKRVYQKIGFLVIFIGIVIVFFLKNIVGDINYDYLYVVYFLYLFNSASLYFISYKDILLMADQKNYKVFKYNCFFTFLLYIFQIVAVLVFSNYVIYIVSFIVFKILNRIFINRYISINYSDVDFNSKEKLTNKDIKVLKSNIAGMFYYKIGDYVINCTDNIIISSFLNVVLVGIYTNYLSIVTIVRTIVKNIFSGITASYGNLSVEKNADAQFNVFKIMTFICFFVSGYVTIVFLNLINPFIHWWIGKEYLLSISSVIIIVINFYLMCNQMPLDTVKESLGFYKKDKFIPVIQAIINIVLSIVLVNFIGFNGVILATTISYIVTVFWNKPFVIYKYLFKRNLFNYFVDQFKYIVSLFLICFITSNILNYLCLNIDIVSMVLSGIIITIVYIFVISLLFFRRDEYKFIFNMVKGIILKLRKKVVK